MFLHLIVDPEENAPALVYDLIANDSGDLSPLASLTSLQQLNLSDCRGIRRFAPLKSLLPTLEYLYLFECQLDDLPPEVCGETYDENVLDRVRAHYEDLKSGQRIDAEVKVLFLGNAGVGKTQLCRRLRGLEFDPSVPTTHGVQVGEMTLRFDGFQEPVRLNLWDFGGQDIYHGSHALFLHGQAKEDEDEWEYIAPELLPEWSDAQEQL
jgi:internalin A